MISAFTKKICSFQILLPPAVLFFSKVFIELSFVGSFHSKYNKVCLISRDRKNPKYSGFHSFVKGFLEHLSALLKRKSMEATIFRTTVSTYSSISNKFILIPCSPLTDLYFSYWNFSASPLQTEYNGCTENLLKTKSRAFSSKLR